MFSTLKLQAFKSFKELTKVKLSPLTIITGMNSSGKSSILQSLLILQKLSENKTIEDAIPEGHGAFKDFINVASTPEDFLIELNNSESKVNRIIKDKYSQEFDMPAFLFIEADRFGSRTSIAVNRDDKLDSKGDNLLKVLRNLEDATIPDEVVHPKSEKQNLLANVQAWLNEISPGAEFKYEIQDKADTSYTLFNDFRSNNVGYGLSYALPVIVALLYGATVPGKCVVLLENPEAHLHPHGQRMMADLICKVAAAGTQVILETHSDHIINGVRVNTYRYETEKPGIDKALVSIVHVSQNDSKQSHILPIEIKERGRIIEAPDDFFMQYTIDRRELLGF